VLTGARQVGKTSLVRRLFSAHSYVSLDLPSEAEQADHDPSAFLARHKRPLLIDEVQYAPGLFRHLKAAIDERRTENGQFILTGSQSFPLMRAVSESLAGRAAILELEGVTVREVLEVRPGSGWEPLLIRGGFPELHEKPKMDANAYLRSYVATYLERDVRALVNIGNLRDFERFLRACALRSGQLLNKAELARDVGISGPTASQWLSVLEASNQVFFLEPWFSNKTRSLVKTPKLYLTDSGLLCHLLGVHDFLQLSTSPLAGPVWETFVASEIRRTLKNSGRAGEIFFWRDRGTEVDFLLHRAGEFALYDAKWTEHPSNRDAANLHSVADQLKGRVTRKALLCRTRNAYPLDQDSMAWPITEIGDQL
jgi:uncharacterized protein